MLKEIVLTTCLMCALNHEVHAANKIAAPLPATVNPIINDNQQRIKYRESLSSLILAEIAFTRGRPDVAIASYQKLAAISKNPKYAEYATEKAIEYRLFQEAQNSAKLWASLDQNNLQAQLVAMTLVINDDKLAAKDYLEQAFKSDNMNVGQHLLIINTQITPASQQYLYDTLQQMIEQQPKNPAVSHSTALIALQHNDLKYAKILVDKSLNIQKDYTPAIQTKARLIRHESANDKEALTYLSNLVAKFSSNNELRLFYAQALLDANKVAEAKTHLAILENNPQYTTVANLQLGQIAFDKNEISTAKKHFNVAEDKSDSDNNFTAKYYLARIAEQENKIDHAINLYREITSGQYHIPASLKASAWLIAQNRLHEASSILHEANPTSIVEQKQILLSEVEIYIARDELEGAFQLMTNALQVLPEDIDLLYSRSLIAIKLNKHDISEIDLRTILKQHPNHAHALNALGYTIVNQPNRGEEGIKYLRQAIALAPNNPAFMDSMGWALFKIGRVEDSISIFKNAYTLSPNADISTHYGEVLWADGKKQAAKDIWKKAIKQFPEHKELQNIIKKYSIKLKK